MNGNSTHSSDLRLRVSRPDDETALRRLAELDSQPWVPTGPYVLAQDNGTLIAALPLDRGSVLADPFRPTADILLLLELRARQLRSPVASARPRRGLRDQLRNLRLA